MEYDHICNTSIYTYISGIGAWSGVHQIANCGLLLGSGSQHYFFFNLNFSVLFKKFLNNTILFTPLQKEIHYYKVVIITINSPFFLYQHNIQIN